MTLLRRNNKFIVAGFRVTKIIYNSVWKCISHGNTFPHLNYEL